MKAKIDSIIEELNNMIQVKELEFIDVLTNAPQIISSLELGFEKLKWLISNYEFKEQNEEIIFFKIQKPKLFSKLIYYQKIYHLELNRPVSSYQTQRFFLERELEHINIFWSSNVDFIQYYRSGKTSMDEFYFLRGKRDIELNLDSFYFERDPKFSTYFDFKVSKLLANDLLAAYINYELTKLKQQENEFEALSPVFSQEKWTDKKTALVEIIYSIHEEKSINAGQIEIKALATILGKIFNVDLSDIYHIYLDIRSRKTNRTEYLSRLIKALNKRMDEADSK
ncbi:hypothetical protein SDC9_131463 [bioreactor metagenome]|uniref:RteC protein n=1 Tax=bioreactor metagenome TaxID=1076179 RepID=A0A645D6Y3_9ZZZZ